MSFVQGNRNASLGTTGGTGPSLSGVVAGHGLFYWMFVDLTVTGSPTISDSNGTTWALVQNIALTTDNESLLCFKTTSAVGAGTHTITPTFAGGGSFFGWLIEDTGAYDGSAVGQRLSGPGAGNTLKPGGNVGSSGDTVYMLAVDALNTGATFIPGLNGFTNIDNGNNASIGTWRLGWNAGVGGTNPAMATGSGDTGGTDEYGVIAIAFLGGSTSQGASLNPRSNPGMRIGTPVSRLRGLRGDTGSPPPPQANDDGWDFWSEEADDDAITMMVDSQPVVADTQDPFVQEEYTDLLEGYDEPEITDYEWSGPIQPNADRKSVV